jgi:ABC-2 type transport system permease protein
MQVFKLCMKIIKKNMAVMLMYVGIFLAVSLIISFSASSEQQNENDFTPVKSNISFISEESSPLIDGLKQELGKVANFVELPDETEALQDALYFRSVSYILRVPRGFTESLMNGENVQLEKTIVPNSSSNVYVDLSVDKYLNTARLYVQHTKDIAQESLVRYLQSDLAAGTSVEWQANGGNSDNYIYENYYFNYLAYSLLAVLILGMTTLMLVVNDEDLKKRNACSPLSAKSVNMQFMLATLLFTLVSWLVMVTFCFIFSSNNSFSTNSVYFIINTFIFAICGASISFLIGNLIKGRGAISAVSNVVTLGPCFISGVFVPQELLGEVVLKIASFTPTYWFVRANNQIATLAKFDFLSVRPILTCILIQAGFALAFFVVALVVRKAKRFS